MTTAIDVTDFRYALGQFATGVTVITSTDEALQPVGVTASSFNSVSLDPPLVLWSLAKNSNSLSAFEQSGYFCVHVLTAAQEDISQKFATKGADKFSDMEWTRGEGQLPLLPEFAARFQCKTTYQYEGGDHVIFVGEVIDFEKTGEPPLVFHAGRYALAKNKDSKERPGDAVNLEQGSFNDNFFLYLLSRAHYQVSYSMHQEFEKAGVNHSEYLTLTVLGMSGALSWQDLQTLIEHTGHAPDHGIMNDMQDKGLVRVTDDGKTYALTIKGRELYISLLAVSKAHEEALLTGFSEAEIADVRGFLQRFIQKTDPGIPSLWQHD